MLTGRSAAAINPNVLTALAPHREGKTIDFAAAVRRFLDSDHSDSCLLIKSKPPFLSQSQAICRSALEVDAGERASSSCLQPQACRNLGKSKRKKTSRTGYTETSLFLYRGRRARTRLRRICSPKPRPLMSLSPAPPARQRRPGSRLTSPLTLLR